MSKPTNITETQLIRLIEDEIENSITSRSYDVEDDIEDEIEIEPEDSYGDELLTPEEIVGLALETRAGREMFWIQSRRL